MLIRPLPRVFFSYGGITYLWFVDSKIQPGRRQRKIMTELQLLRRLHFTATPLMSSPHLGSSSNNVHNLITMASDIRKAATMMRRSTAPRKISLLQLNSTGPKSSAIRTFCSVSPTSQPLDLTEDNIELVLSQARLELGQIFDTEVGMTGKVELAELDGPFVKIRLTGRFWHKRSTVLARVGNFLKQKIPEILEVDIEDEKQLDDSPANF